MHGGDHRGRADRLEAAVEPDTVRGPGDRSGPNVSRVPESHVHDTFDVDGIETARREKLLETALVDIDAVSAASATARNGTVGIHHDPEQSRDQLRQELESYGLIVAPGDDAFASRRAAQFDSARIAVAVLFGLMVAVPYIGVLYPTRVEWLFYDPVTVAYLQSILESRVATHFFVNLAALSGIAFIVACGPTIRRAIGSVTAGQPTGEVAFVSGVVLVYTYSTLAAFTSLGGGVHYDLVAYATVGAVLWTHVGTDATTDVTDRTDTETVSDSSADAGSMDEEEPVALTDGG